MDKYKANIYKYMKNVTMLYEGNFYQEVMYISNLGYPIIFVFNTSEEANEFICIVGTSHVDFKTLSNQYDIYLQQEYDTSI